jgi:hypothetical protein
VKPFAILGAALAAVAVALAAPVAPARAGGFTLALSAQSQAVVGRPLTLQVTGTIPPPGEIAIPYWFSLDAIPTAVSATCPRESWQGQQIAAANGGSIVVLTAAERSDAAGNFAFPVVVTPSAPGTVLLCAYTDNGAFTTLATASLLLDIAPPGQPGGNGTPPGGSSPPSHGSGSRPPSPPAYTAQGVRMCRAVLAGKKARPCIHDIVRRANARCRRLHARHARTHCLRAVRRAARRSS